MHTSPIDSALRQARLHLLEHGECPPEGVNAHVARSWRRSLAAGLLPSGQLRDTEHANSADLKRAMASQRELLTHSRPVMEVLYEQVRDRESMVILADARGTLMHTLGRTDFLQRAHQVALSCGASWHEQHRGTNAIGTALAERCGIEIRGAEHFLERNNFLNCTAAPILSAKGDLCGVLDISCDQRAGHPHTFGLVSMAARLIENRLISASYQRHTRLHLHRQPAGIGTVAEGIVVLSGDGWVLGSNSAGLALLGMSQTSLGAVKLNALMDVPLDQLLTQHKRRPGVPTPVHRHDGELLFVVVQQDSRTLAGQPASVDETRAPDRTVSTASADSAHSGGLSEAFALLDTGDVRWRRAAEKALKVVDKPIPLLIQGESGVGKELFARAVHTSGPRRHKPFVAINCAAVPENLIEAELFGYSPGAFTGARREGSQGRLREAHGGTLFLDEIGDMPLALQARLLRALQERQVSPLGGGPVVPVDFALICATHCKLREAAEQGRFRSDLFYRINGLMVQLPALRDRTDFVTMTEHLLADLNPQRCIDVAPQLLERLRRYAWPGNLRQYANALRTASAMLDPNETCIDWQHLSEDLLEDLSDQETTAQLHRAMSPIQPTTIDVSQNLRQLSQAAMRQALDHCGGNMSQAAKRLGISRQTLYRKLG